MSDTTTVAAYVNKWLGGEPNIPSSSRVDHTVTPVSGLPSSRSLSQIHLRQEERSGGQADPSWSDTGDGTVTSSGDSRKAMPSVGKAHVRPFCNKVQ